MMTTKTAPEYYTEPFEAFLQDSLGAPGWLTALRKRAFTAFMDQGFPDRKDEEWRFTPLGAIPETHYERPKPVSLQDVRSWLTEQPLWSVDAYRLVFVNGRFVSELSDASGLPAGVTAISLAEAIRLYPEALEGRLGTLAEVETNPFVAWNTAFLDDGAYLRIERTVQLERPIQMLFVTAGANRPMVIQPHILIDAAEYSSAQFIESYLSLPESAALTNPVTEVLLERGANLDHVKVTLESGLGSHIAAMAIALEADSHFRSQNLTLTGAMVRNDHTAVFRGEHAECILNGMFLARGRQLIDNHTSIDHALPNCNSHELYKGILDDRARGVFNGKIMVRQDAQKTDARQTNKTLLLSREAVMDTKPQLEIFADDVRCTHGATVGQIEEEQLFYLQSRGIAPEEARNMLIYAFADEILDEISNVSLQSVLHPLLFSVLKQDREE